MNFITDYLPLAQRTEKMYPTAVERVVHAALGIGSEIGELFDRQLDASEELGDLLWYMAIFFNAYPGLIIATSERAYTTSFDANRDLFVHEAGELIGLVKKMHVYNQPFQAVEEAMCARLSKMMWGVHAMALSKALHLSNIMEANINKLRKRYPEKYNDEDAAARADKA